MKKDTNYKIHSFDSKPIVFGTYNGHDISWNSFLHILLFAQDVVYI